MSAILDKPVLGVILVVLASVVLFVPTLVAHFRRLQAFPSVSALNAMTALLVALTAVSPWCLLAALAIWAVAVAWSVIGRKRDA